MSSSQHSKGEIVTLIATAVVVLVSVTTFIATTFLNKSNKKLSYQSKAMMKEEEGGASMPAPDTSSPSDTPVPPPANNPTGASRSKDQQCYDDCYGDQNCYNTCMGISVPTSAPTLSCDCVNGTYQGSGCVGGQINEPCSSSANLSCFDQCLSQGGGVEACNKECNKLEDQGLLNTPTPGVGGNVCGKIGESPNDLYGCCPGLINDPDAGYCRPSVAVGKSTPTPRPFWMLPNITPTIYSAFPTPTLSPDEQRWAGYGDYCKKYPTSPACGGPTPTKAVMGGAYDDFYKCLNQFPSDSPNRGVICSEFLTPAVQRTPTPAAYQATGGCKIGSCCDTGSYCQRTSGYTSSCVSCGGDKSCIPGKGCDFNIGQPTQTNTARMENGQCYAYIAANEFSPDPYRISVNNSLCAQGATTKVDLRTVIGNLTNPQNAFEIRMINNATGLASDKYDIGQKANGVISVPLDAVSTGIDYIKWAGRKGLGNLTNNFLGDKDAPFEDSYAKLMAADAKAEAEAKTLGKSLAPCIWGCVNNAPRTVVMAGATIIDTIPFVGGLFTGKENGIGDAIIDAAYSGEPPEIIAQQKTFAGGVGSNITTGMVIAKGTDLSVTKHSPNALQNTASRLDSIAERFDPLGAGTSRAVTTLTRMSNAFETAAKGVEYVDKAARVVNPSTWINKVSPSFGGFLQGTAVGRLIKYSMDKPVKQDINKKVQGK